jgi:hypothetical protein
MARYAENTKVPAERSRSEIERTLTRYGADQFMYGWEAERAIIAFRMQARMVRLTLPMPDMQEFMHGPSGRLRSSAAAEQAYKQATRQRWRALALVVKAKLEAVEAGISTFEQEFLAAILLPDGSTVSEMLTPQIERAYKSGTMPKGLRLQLTAGSDDGA